MTNPIYSVDLVDPKNGKPAMVKIIVGSEELMLGLDEAYALADCIENMADYASVQR